MKLLTVLLWFVSNDLNYRLAEVHDPKVMTYPGELYSRSPFGLVKDWAIQ